MLMGLRNGECQVDMVEEEKLHFSRACYSCRLQFMQNSPFQWNKKES